MINWIFNIFNWASICLISFTYLRRTRPLAFWKKELFPTLEGAANKYLTRSASSVQCIGSASQLQAVNFYNIPLCQIVVIITRRLSAVGVLYSRPIHDIDWLTPLIDCLLVTAKTNPMSVVLFTVVVAVVVWHHNKISMFQLQYLIIAPFTRYLYNSTKLQTH